MDFLTLLRLSVRNLARQKRRFALLISSVGFGFLIIIVMNAISGGMTRSVNTSAARHYAGHLFILGHQKTPYYTPVVRDDAALMAAVKAADIHPRLVVRRTNYFERGMLFFSGESARQKRITGVDWSVEEGVFRRMEFASGGAEDLANTNGILVSAPIAGTLKVRVGDDILVQVETVTGQRNTDIFVVRGIFRDSSIFGYYSSFVDLRRLNRLIGLKDDEYTILGLYLDDLRQAGRVADKLHEELSSRVPMFVPVATQPDLWARLDEQWEGVKYAVLTLDGYLYQVRDLLTAFDAAAYFLLVLILGIVMIGITTTYRVIVFERIREIGTMRALGMSSGHVVALFLVEALILAVAGMLAGGFVAVVLIKVVALLSFDWIPGFEIFMDRGHLAPFLPPGFAVINIVAIFVVTLLAAWVPSRGAGRVDPAVALRMDA